MTQFDTEIHVEGGRNRDLLQFSCFWFLTALSELELPIDPHGRFFIFVSLYRLFVWACFWK